MLAPTDDELGLLSPPGNSAPTECRSLRIHSVVMVAMGFTAVVAAIVRVFSIAHHVSQGPSKQSNAIQYLSAKFAQAAGIIEEGVCGPRDPDLDRDLSANVRDRGIMLDHNFESIDPQGFSRGVVDSYEAPPSQITRDLTIYDRCACQTGLHNITLWPEHRQNESISVLADGVRWVRWTTPVQSIRWFCSGMRFSKKTEVNLDRHQWFSIKFPTMNSKGSAYPIGCCNGKLSGFLHLNTWSPTPYMSSMPFISGTSGYFCFKIPAMLRTLNGTFIAFAEARRHGCSDFSSTDLVYRRSTDNGRTWGDLQVLVKVPEEDRERLGLCGFPLVIGNIAPVQLRLNSPHHPGRILAPYTRNNFKAWLIYSDDDGVTWQGDRELINMTVTDPQVAYDDAKPDCGRGMSYFGFSNLDKLNLRSVQDVVMFAESLCTEAQDPYHNTDRMAKMTGPWQFIGVGPPGSLQLRSGRVLVPAFHSYIRGLEGNGTLPLSQLYNNFALGHTMISDDGGDSWRLSYAWGVGEGANENQMVELPDGTVLSIARSLATGSPQHRMQARSTDQGNSFSASAPTEIPQPFNGCQGSAVSGDNGTVYVSGPDPLPSTSWLQKTINILRCSANLTGRSRVSVWKSNDGGRSFPSKTLIDPGLSAQTSLQFHAGKLYMLYEQADPSPQVTIEDKLMHNALQDLRVLLPNRFVFRDVAA